MQLGVHEIARIAYVASQSALAQVGGSAGVEWDSLTAAQRDAQITSAAAQLNLGHQSAHIVGSVGGNNSLKAANVFNSVVNALMLGKK
jgi:hypothetical protein